MAACSHLLTDCLPQLPHNSSAYLQHLLPRSHKDTNSVKTIITVSCKALLLTQLQRMCETGTTFYSKNSIILTRTYKAFERKYRSMDYYE